MNGCIKEILSSYVSLMYALVLSCRTMTFSLGRVVLKEAKEDMWLGFKTTGTFTLKPKVVPGPWGRKQNSLYSLQLDFSDLHYFISLGLTCFFRALTQSSSAF